MKAGLRLSRLPVGRLVALFVALSLGPLALLAYSSVSLAGDAVSDEARARLRSTASVSAVSIEKELNGLSELVESYARRPTLVNALASGFPEGDDRSAIDYHLAELRAAKPGLAVVFVTDPGGRLSNIDPYTASTIGQDFSFRDWYRGVSGTWRPYVSEAYESAAAGKPRVVGVAAPVWAPGQGQSQPRGILVGAYGLQAIQSLSDDVAAAQAVNLTVTDQRGVIVAGSGARPTSLVSRREDVPVRAALDGRSGLVERDVRGERVLSAFSPVRGSGWTVTADVPSSSAFAAVSRMRSTVLAIAGGLSLVLLAGMALLIVTLRGRRQVESNLQESEERNRGILEAASDAFVSMDAAGVITGWNAQAEATFGWDRSEAVGLKVEDTILPPDEWDAHRRRLARSEACQGPDANAPVQITAQRRGSERFPAELAMWPVQMGETWSFNAFVRDITERQETEEALTEAHEQAMEASRLKSEFVANMSHEIRTPMNGVIGMTALLSSTDLSPDQREYAETIRRSGEALLTVVDKILDFSKIEAGKIDIEVTDFDLRATVEEVAQLLADGAASKGLELATAVDPDLPAVIGGDPTRLRQVLLNLAGNAIKFTDAGQVVIRAGVAEQDADDVLVRFEVSDTGPGVSAASKDRLFESFSQADASTTRRHGGTGLGLAIAKSLAELMGGEIGLDSTVGVGATFWFTARLHKRAEVVPATLAQPDALCEVRVLVVDDTEVNRVILEQSLLWWGMRPATACDAEQALTVLEEATSRGQPYQVAILDQQMPGRTGVELAEAVVASPAISTPRMVLLTSVGRRGEAGEAREAGIEAHLTKPVRQSALYECLTKLMGATTAVLPPTPRPDSHGEPVPTLRILVVDDNVTNQKVAVGLLENRGHRVDVANDGLEAVEAVSQHRYDAVLMDCQMPTMDGFEATREIRRCENGGRRTPIIAMTASAMRSDKDKCLAAGMDDFLAKPVQPAQLEAAVRRWSASNHVDDHRHSAERSAVAPDAAEGWSGNEVVDPTRWAMLQGLNRNGILTEAVAAFFDGARNQVAALRDAVSAGDARRARQAAHVLAGGSGNLGANRVFAGSSELESVSKSGQLPSLGAIEVLEVELGRAEEAIGALMADGPA